MIVQVQSNYKNRKDIAESAETKNTGQSREIRELLNRPSKG